MARGSSRGAWGARLLFIKAEERGGRSHDARRGRRLLRRRAWTVPSRAGKGTAPTCGAGRSAAAGTRKARWLCWAGSGAGLAAGAGPSEACKEGGELGRRGGELGQQKESLRAKIQEGREK